MRTKKDSSKLLFLYDMAPEYEVQWKDGLWAALSILKSNFFLTTANIETDRYEDKLDKADFILGWGGSTSRIALLLANLNTNIPKGLCFGGGDIQQEILDDFSVVFVENKIDLIKPHFRHAFGTNTDVFYPMIAQPKIIDAIYPASFARWKRQEKFAKICEAEGLKGLAVGIVQKNNQEESWNMMEHCIARGVAVMDQVPYETMAYLYNMSKQVILTADENGGSQRAVLEAKACRVPIRIESDSRKLLELGELSEDEVINNWNHESYAEALTKGIKECLKS